MKKIILSSLLLFAFVNISQAQIIVPEFGKFFTKHFRVSPTFRQNCEFSYFSVLVHTDNMSKISRVEFKSQVPDDMKVYFDFLKEYKFPAQYSIKNQPVLFFITFDRNSFCPDFSVSNGFINGVMRESLLTIKKQLVVNPKTVVIYETIDMTLWKGTVN